MDDDLITTWIQYYLHEEDKNFWAFKQMEELVLNEPEKAWAVF